MYSASTDIYTYGHTLSLHDVHPILAIICHSTLPVTFSRGGARGNTRARILWIFREDKEWTAAARCNFPTARRCFITATAAPGKSRSSRRSRRSEEHTSELQSLMRNSYAVFCLQQNTEK